MHNPEEIICLSRCIAEQAATLEKQVERITVLIEENGTVWESSAQEKFSQNFEKIKPPLFNFCKQIDILAKKAMFYAMR